MPLIFFISKPRRSISERGVDRSARAPVDSRARVMHQTELSDTIRIVLAAWTFSRRSSRRSRDNDLPRFRRAIVTHVRPRRRRFERRVRAVRTRHAHGHRIRRNVRVRSLRGAADRGPVRARRRRVFAILAPPRPPPPIEPCLAHSRSASSSGASPDAARSRAPSPDHPRADRAPPPATPRWPGTWRVRRRWP